MADYGSAALPVGVASSEEDNTLGAAVYPIGLFASAVGSQVIELETGGSIPVVDNFDPPDGTGLASKDSPISFDVTDPDSETVYAFVYATFMLGEKILGAPELIWDGDAFSAAYSLSSRVAITNGYRYTVRRNRGWHANFTITARGIDDTGGRST